MRVMAISLVLLTAAACRRSPPGPDPNAAVPAAWKLGGNVSYLLGVQRVETGGTLGPARNSNIDLVFQPAPGDVVVTTNGVPVRSRMSLQGALNPSDPKAPYLYWALMLTQVLPPDGTASVGEKWTLSRPDDASFAGSDSLVTQARVKYEVVSVSPDLVIRYEGEQRVAPSPGLDALARDFGVPVSAAAVIGRRWQPFLQGKTTFSLASGRTLRAEGDVRPFAALGAGGDVSTHPARLHFTITQR